MARAIDNTLAHETNYDIITLKRRHGATIADDFRTKSSPSSQMFKQSSQSKDAIDLVTRRKKYPERNRLREIDNISLRYRENDDEKQRNFTHSVDDKVMTKFRGYKLHQFDPILQEHGDKHVNELAEKQTEMKRQQQLHKWEDSLPEYIKTSDGSNYNVINMTVRNQEVLDKIDAKNDSSLIVHQRNQELLKEMKKKRMKQAMKRAEKRALNKTVPAKFVEYEKGHDTITNQSYTGIDAKQPLVDTKLLSHQEDVWGKINDHESNRKLLAGPEYHTKSVTEWKGTRDVHSSMKEHYNVVVQPPRPKSEGKVFLPPQRLRVAPNSGNIISNHRPPPAQSVVTNAKLNNNAMRRIIRTNGFDDK
jgi:hypothetical protein